MVKATAERKNTGDRLFIIQPEGGVGNDSHKSQVLCAPDTLRSPRWFLIYADGTLKPHFPEHGTEYALGGERAIIHSNIGAAADGCHCGFPRILSAHTLLLSLASCLEDC